MSLASYLEDVLEGTSIAEGRLRGSAGAEVSHGLGETKRAIL